MKKYFFSQTLKIPILVLTAFVFIVISFNKISICAEKNELVRIAILKDNLPSVDVSLVEIVTSVLKNQKCAVTQISFDQLASPSSFNTALFDCLILTHNHNFTNIAKENFFNFIKGGGDLILVGGHGFIQKRSMEFPAFSDYDAYKMEDIKSIATYTDQVILDRKPDITGTFQGISAVGITKRNQSKFVPILSALDKYDRSKGWACGLLINYAGDYKGSSWLLFGISTPEFYQTTGFSETLGAMISKMKSGNIGETAERENKETMAQRIKLKTPAPVGFIKRSDDGKHLVYPDGKRFFLTGCNYHRSLDMLFWNNDTFDVTAFEDDFRKMRDAGMNAVRIAAADAIYDDPEKVEALKECARKYGVYLMISVRWGTEDRTSEDLISNAAKIAQLFKDEPMVFGYDLQNEPSITEVGSIIYNGEKSPVLKLKPYEKYAGKFNKEAVDKRLETMPPQYGKLDKDDMKNLAALNELWGKAVEHVNRGAATTYPGLIDKLQVPEEWKELFTAVNETFDLWIKLQIEAIRKHDKNHLITVGYNQVFSCLPTNEQLDFVSIHVYDNPPIYENVMTNMTTFDRLAKVWPNKPITLGEFGYSNGIVIPDGSYLDLYSSAVTEMISFLYPLAHDYEGSKKWMLTDWHWTPLNWGRDWATKVYESRFGFYIYDGTLQGRPKPLCSALKFFRDYVDNSGAGGTIEIKRGPLPFIPVYLYKGKDALFVGDINYKSPQLEFVSKHPTNVMVSYAGNEIKIMSSSDAVVKITPSDFIPQITVKQAKITGTYGSLKRERNKIIIDMLEGQTIVLK